MIGEANFPKRRESEIEGLHDVTNGQLLDVMEDSLVFPMMQIQTAFWIFNSLLGKYKTQQSEYKIASTLESS